jgi:hypothetical protein
MNDDKQVGAVYQALFTAEKKKALYDTKAVCLSVADYQLLNIFTRFSLKSVEQSLENETRLSESCDFIYGPHTHARTHTQLYPTLSHVS